jgi:hypothetical protein
MADPTAAKPPISRGKKREIGQIGLVSREGAGLGELAEADGLI